MGPQGSLTAAGPALSPPAVHAYFTLKTLVSLICVYWGGAEPSRYASNVVTVVRMPPPSPSVDLSPRRWGRTLHYTLLCAGWIIPAAAAAGM